MARSSANVEDLAGMSGAGKFLFHCHWLCCTGFVKHQLH